MMSSSVPLKNSIIRNILSSRKDWFLIKFTFYFAGKADTLPVLKGLNFDEKDAFVIEKNQRNDTIHYWVKDSLLFKQDTLAMSLTYLYTDTLNQLVPRTDTLNLVSKQKYKKEESDKDKKEKRRKERGRG